MSKASAALKQAEAQAEAQAAPQQGGLTREDTHNDTQRRIAETMTAVKALHGSEKAAILLLSLGEDAKPVWDRLDDEELREISSAMSNLGPVKAEMVEFLIKDFVNRLSGSGAVTGSYEQTHRLLLQFLPAEKVDNLMEELRGPAGRTMWDKLGNVNEQVLANYLKNEYRRRFRSSCRRSRPSIRRAFSPPCPQTSRSKSCSGCCAWSRCSAIFSRRSSRPCAPSS